MVVGFSIDDNRDGRPGAQAGVRLPSMPGSTSAAASEPVEDAELPGKVAFGEELSDRPDFPRLNVVLVKERLELEVAMVREGMRLFIFAAFCICFCMAAFLSIAPHARNDSQWHINKELGLSGMEEVTSPASTFHYIMDVSSAVREFFPVSSAYVGDTLSKTLIGSPRWFRKGSVTLHESLHPTLLLEWSLTARLTVEDPEDPDPPSRLVLRQYLSIGGERITCWALYCQGLSHFTFEYGEHQLEDGYAVINLDFPAHADASTQHDAELVLIALNVNTSHVNMLVEDPHSRTPRSITKRLPPGTIPTECSDGLMKMGDKGLQVADMKYRPRMISEIQFDEIKEAGDTLEDIATGIAVESPSDDLLGNSKESSESGTQDTQDLMQQLSQQEQSLIQLSGLLIQPETAEAVGHESLVAPFFEPGSQLPEGASPPSEENDPLTGLPYYWQIVSGVREMDEDNTADDDDDDDDDGMAAGNGTSRYMQTSVALTAAFQRLSNAGHESFTLTWWATGSERTQSREFAIRARFNASDFVQWRLYVAYLKDAGQWLVKMNGAPDCTNPRATTAQRELCKRSPAFWCTAPPYAGPYDGIERFFAIRYSHGNAADEVESSIKLYQDGHPLCGVKFFADPLFIPHRSGTPGFAPIEVRFGLTDGGLLLRNMRLFTSALHDDYIAALVHSWGSDTPCRSLSNIKDDPTYITLFGQGCKDIGNLMDEQNAAAGCYTAEVMERCPVSCVGIFGKLCYDGTPPVPRARSRNRVGRKIIVADEEGPPPATWVNDNEFIPLWASIERVRFGTFASSRTVMERHLLADRTLQMDGDFWLTPSPNGGPLTCPGLKFFEDPDIDDDNDVNPVISRICKAGVVYRRMEEGLVSAGKVKDVETTMNIASDGPYGGGFPPGMMVSGNSFTLYFWANTHDIAGGRSISLAGIDSDHNLCFDITASSAYLLKRGVVRAFEAGGRVPPGKQYYRDRTRLGITAVPPKDFQRDTWVFYALIVNAKTNTTTFMINDMFVSQTLEGLEAGLWGCNGLEQVVNTGSDLLLSPMRISSLALSIGDMQRRYLTRRKAYDLLTGPKRSRLGLSELNERPRRRYTNRMIALSPPLVLQTRFGSHDGNCKGDTNKRVKEMLGQLEERRCVAPFICDNNTMLDIPCISTASVDDKTFFGRNAMSYKDALVYPEFAWILQSPTLVRDGKDLVPENDYLDPYTKEVTLLLSFYTPDTQVASVLEVIFSLKSARVDTTLQIRQLKLANMDGFHEWLAWNLSAMLLAVLFMALALKPGLAEIRATYRSIARSLGVKGPKWFIRYRNKLLPLSTFGVKPKPRVYTADTSQPDALDIVMSLIIIVFLAMSIPMAYEKTTTGQDVFGDMGSIDWSNNTRQFSDKVDEFLETTRRTVELTSKEIVMSNFTFWMLILFAIRMIIFMKVHPAISSICQTFQVVTVELVNFLLSFGVIFVMLAFTAFLRFGYRWDEFRTFNDALMTQFYILIGDSNPETKGSTLMALYVVGFVFVCTLALLNFLLAIVVNGYTAVCEKASDVIVARTIMADIMSVPLDGMLWLRHYHWPSKLHILNALSAQRPEQFGHLTEQAEYSSARSRNSKAGESDNTSQTLTVEEFESVVAEASHRRASREDAWAIYNHLCRLKFLHMPDEETS